MRRGLRRRKEREPRKERSKDRKRGEKKEKSEKKDKKRKRGESKSGRRHVDSEDDLEVQSGSGDSEHDEDVASSEPEELASDASDEPKRKPRARKRSTAAGPKGEVSYPKEDIPPEFYDTYDGMWCRYAVVLVVVSHACVSTVFRVRVMSVTVVPVKAVDGMPALGAPICCVSCITWHGNRRRRCHCRMRCR